MEGPAQRRPRGGWVFVGGGVRRRMRAPSEESGVGLAVEALAGQRPVSLLPSACRQAIVCTLKNKELVVELSLR